MRRERIMLISIDMRRVACSLRPPLRRWLAAGLPPTAPQGWIARAEQRVADSHPVARAVLVTLKAYAVGTRLLLQNAYKLYATRTQPVTALGELMFRQATTWDLIKGGPLLLWYLVPIVGNSVLLVGYAAPNILPACWHTPAVRARLMRGLEARARSLLLPPAHSPGTHRPGREIMCHSLLARRLHRGSL